MGRWSTHLGESYLSVMDYVPAHNSEELASALGQIRSSYQMVVFSGLTNIIVKAGSEVFGGRLDRLEAIEKSIKATLMSFG